MDLKIAATLPALLVAGSVSAETLNEKIMTYDAMGSLIEQARQDAEGAINGGIDDIAFSLSVGYRCLDDFQLDEWKELAAQAFADAFYESSAWVQSIDAKLDISATICTAKFQNHDVNLSGLINVSVAYAKDADNNYRALQMYRDQLYLDIIEGLR